MLDALFGTLDTAFIFFTDMFQQSDVAYLNETVQIDQFTLLPKGDDVIIYQHDAVTQQLQMIGIEDNMKEAIEKTNEIKIHFKSR